MAQSALRALMQDGPAPAGMASAQTAIQNAAQRPQPKPMGQQVADVLGGVALPLSTVPVVGDIAGLGADAAMYANYPEERTALNYGMTLAGMLPFVPGAAGVRAAEGALDMSQAARMQRAQDMGFDTERVFYHGTTSDFDKFDLEKAGKNDSGWYGRGIYLTPDPDTASAYTQYQEYAQRTGADGANVLPVRVRIKNPYYWPEGRNAALNKEESEAITQELLAQGFDGVVVPNKYADPKFADMYEVVAFSPEQVRSVNAEFNPANRGSANLMAGVMGGAVGLSALRQLMPQQEQE